MSWFSDNILGRDRGDPPQPPVWDEGGVTLNIDRKDAPLPAIYGRRNVGCVRRYIDVSGANTEFLHLVLIWGEGEIDAVENLYLDGVISTDPKFAGLLQITHHMGADNQAADANLMAEIPWWTSLHKGGGTAYTAIRLEYKKGVFRGYPKFRADIRGIKCLDTRNQSAPKAFTSNPALITYDYATAGRYGGGIPAAEIDVAAISVEANYCDTARQIHNGAPTTHALYQFDGVIKTDKRVRNNIDTILETCRGALPLTGGLSTLTLDKPGVSDFSFYEDNIIGRWSIDFGTARNTLNRVSAGYINPLNDWQKDTVVVDEPAFRAQDGGRLLEKKLTLDNTTDIYRATDLCTLMMRQSRQGIRASFTAAPEAMQCRIGGLCDITHATPGWVSKLFRVTKIQEAKNALVRVSVAEYDATVYNLSIPNTAPTAPNTNLPDSAHVGYPVSFVLVSDESTLTKVPGGAIMSRIKATWIKPPQDPYIDGYEIQLKKTSDPVSAWKITAVTSDPLATEVITSIVDESVSYDMRVRAVNGLGFVSVWVTRSIVAGGKSTPPPNVPSFLVQRQADGTRQITWDYPNPPIDIAGFRLYYAVGPVFTAITTPNIVAGKLYIIETVGTTDYTTIGSKNSVVGAVFKALGAGLGTGTVLEVFALQDGLVGSSPFETNQLSAGTYRFYIHAEDTSGNRSATPKMIELPIGNPRIAGSIATLDAKAEGWTGTLTNALISNGVIIADDQATWDSLGTLTWDAWAAWSSNPFTTITFQRQDHDLGVVTTFAPLPTATGNGVITMDEQHSSDNITWSAWAAMTGQSLTTRYIRVRVTASTAGGGFNGPPTIEQFQTILSADPISEDANDLDTSTLTGVHRIAVGHIKVPITKTYAGFTRVQVALQNLGVTGGSIWWWELVSKADTINGPEIKIHKTTNGVDALVDAVIDVYIKGV